MADPADAVAEQVKRWQADRSEGAAWDARALVDRLSKGGERARAVDFGEAALARWPAFAPLQSALAWAYYRRDIAPVQADSVSAEARQQATRAAQRIKALTSSEPYGRYSAWPIAALQVSKILMARWPRQALKVLDQLDPGQLSTTPRDDYPSNAARWHLQATKVLADLAEWDELLAHCDRALGAPGCRAEDARLIRRRRAHALEHLGRAEEAVSALEALQREIPDWWVEADLARVLAATGRSGDAIAAGRRALSKPGRLSAKWRTVLLVGQLLQSHDGTLAREHVRLARNLRQSEGWPPDAVLEGAAAEMGIDEAPTKPDASALRRTWQTADPSRNSGVVKTLLPGDQSGFITVDGDGADVYFAMPKGATKSAPPPGTQVTFRLVDGFDKKKNRPAKKAVDVEPRRSSA